MSLAVRISLRVKLVTALLALATVGLVSAGATGVVALRGYLLDRVDSQLEATAPRTGRGPAPPTGADDARPALSTAFYARVAAADGTVIREDLQPPGRGDPDQTAPALPATPPIGEPITVPADGAGHDWRVLVERRSGGGTVTVAVTVNDVDDTMTRLAAIELAVGVAVLAVLAALGYLAVRSSLRPLVEVELESAFRAREASEASARASEQRMRRFVADASHELRTPLTSIRGFAELHRQGAIPDSVGVAEVFRRIEDEAARMGLLVDDLLLLARLDRQRPLQHDPVDLLALAADAVTCARVCCPDRQITLAARGGTDDPPPVVLGDEPRLRQVLGNLLFNAAAHTPAGTAIRVELSTTASTARLSVADQGPGLAPEDAERIFERFYRVDSARGREHGGAGLGLSIVAALVAAHDGTVTVRSTPGEGTCFDVDLPLLRTHSQLPAQSEAAPRHVGDN